MVLADVGYVVPTLGTRNDKLEASIQSLIEADVGSIVVVAPVGQLYALGERFQNPTIRLVCDPQNGLAAAINHGIARLSNHIKYVNWLGDDDQIIPQSIAQLRLALVSDSKASLCYARCEYRSDTGLRVFQTRARIYYPTLMRFGPQLISQPAILFRKDLFDQLGGLREELQFAFDLDMLIRLKSQGRFVRLNTAAAVYGWHPEALSVFVRKAAVLEASRVRYSHLPSFGKFLAKIYEPVMRALIYITGQLVSLRAGSANTKT